MGRFVSGGGWMNDKRVVRGKRGVIKERAMNGGRKFEVFWMGQILNLEK